MNKLLVLFVLVCIFTIQSVFGAQVHGSIYNHDLTVIRDVVVLVNSTPQQRHVSKYGGYSFDLEPGSYTIRATLTQNFITKEIASEDVTISQDGTYIVDLFIHPDVNITQAFAESENPWWVYATWIIGSLLVVLILFVAILFLRTFFWKRGQDNPKTNDSSTTSVSESQVHFNIEIDSENPIIPIQIEDDREVLKKRILELLAKNDGQLSQKEIRKKTMLSEAKISHTISELYTEQKVTKIRQGRSNIVILK